MKKTLVALAIMGMAGTTAANAATSLYDKDGTSVDLSGRVEPRMSVKDEKAADFSRARLGFTFKQQITPDFYAIGYYEGQFNSTSSTDSDQGKPTYAPSGSETPEIFNRYLYAGLGGTFGEVTYGKTEGALNQITDFTDIMMFHGASAATKVDLADHTNNMVAYSGSYENLSIKASYKFADRGKTIKSDLKEHFIGRSNNGYSLSALYAIGDSGFKLGAGYADAKLTMLDPIAPGITPLISTNYQGHIKQTMAGASFAKANFYFGGLYINQHFKAANLDASSVNQNGYEFAAAYTLEKTTFRMAYNALENSTYNHVKTVSVLPGKVKNLALDTSYAFMPNFTGYVSYNFNLLKGKDVGPANAANELALGMRYDF